MTNLRRSLSANAYVKPESVMHTDCSDLSNPVVSIVVTKLVDYSGCHLLHKPRKVKQIKDLTLANCIDVCLNSNNFRQFSLQKIHKKD
jgi:hypothetical protein